MVKTQEFDNPHSAAIEEIWALMRENAQQMKEFRESQREENEKLRRENEIRMQENEIRIREENEKLRRENEKQRRENEIRRQENDRRMLENDRRIQENDRRIQENEKQRQEDDRKRQETDSKMQGTDRYLKKLSRQMGHLHNSFGKMAEHLVAPGIAKRFNELGFNFDIMAREGVTISESGKTKTQIDLLLENGDYIIAVEVKIKVQADSKHNDIDHHIRRLEILRDFRAKHRYENKKILGAIASVIFDDQAKEAALQAGLYVLVQSGDTIQMGIPEGFVPREF